MCSYASSYLDYFQKENQCGHVIIETCVSAEPQKNIKVFIGTLVTFGVESAKL